MNENQKRLIKHREKMSQDESKPDRSPNKCRASQILYKQPHGMIDNAIHAIQSPVFVAHFRLMLHPADHAGGI